MTAECDLLVEARAVAEQGATLQERGRRAVVLRADPRSVIVVRLDSARGRLLVGMGDSDPVCDGLFLLLDETPWRAVLVELKGRNVANAVVQLERTVAATRSRLERDCPFPPEIVWDGAIVCREAPPAHTWRSALRRLRHRFRSVVVRVRERLDIRTLA